MKEEWDVGVGYLKTPLSIVDGYVQVPSGPGLGIAVDEEVVKERVYAGDWDSPRLYADDDGTIIDW
jgi:galactonate dehydratase